MVTSPLQWARSRGLYARAWRYRTSNKKVCPTIVIDSRRRRFIWRAIFAAVSWLKLLLRGYGAAGLDRFEGPNTRR